MTLGQYWNSIGYKPNRPTDITVIYTKTYRASHDRPIAPLHMVQHYTCYRLTWNVRPTSFSVWPFETESELIVHNLVNYRLPMHFNAI